MTSGTLGALSECGFRLVVEKDTEYLLGLTKELHPRSKTSLHEHLQENPTAMQRQAGVIGVPSYHPGVALEVHVFTRTF